MKRESSKARQAFEDYYALGPIRSLGKLHQRYGENTPNTPTQSLDTLKRWSTSFNWPGRVQERDDVAIRKTEKKVTDAVADMRARQARLGQKLQDKGIERLKKLKSDEMSPRDTITMIVEGVKIERQARGEEAPALDISVLIAEATSNQSISIVALSESIFKRAMEAKGAVQAQEIPETQEEVNDGTVSVPD